MSHRVTTKTQITDKNLATQALKAAGWSYSEEGNSVLRINSGPMNRSVLDLRTGNITGDTDWHNKGTLGALRRHYSEQKVRQEANKTGATIESREVLKNGDVRLVLTANFG
jgi:hypothetical protein